MKTTKLFLMAALALTFAACSNDNYDAAQPAKGEGIPFTATISIGDGATTRALSESGTKLVASWAEGEKVALIHNSVSDEMTVSTVNNGVATITGTITGSPSNGDAVTVIYPSTAADGTTGNVKADLLYAQEGGTLSDVASKYDVRKGTGTLKVSGTASLNGNVSLANQFAIFKFTTQNGSADINVSALTVTIGEQAYVITPSSATSTLYAALPAVSSQTVSFTATGSDSKTYAFSKDNVSFTKGKFYQSTLKMAEQANGPEAVDLGLSVEWANMNVGAARESDYGDFFAWGETEPYYSSQDPLTWKTDKSNGYAENWSSYKFTTDGGNSFTKYTGSDNKTTLEAADDAAAVNWGGSWRMPTKAEWEELYKTSPSYPESDKIDGYSWEWYNGSTKKYNGYSTAGYLIVVTKDCAQKGNSIFLPAAGVRIDKALDDQGSGGNYLSSTLYEGKPDCAWCPGFGMIAASLGPGAPRCFGFSVRPVREVAAPAPAYKLLSAVTTSDYGKVVCAAGHLHDANTPVPSGCTGVGVIAKVTDGGHGLIMSLQDADENSWTLINFCTSVTYAGSTMKRLDGWMLGSLPSYTSLGSIAVSNWCIASKDDYIAMFQNLGSQSSADPKSYDSNVNAKITSAGGTALNDGYNWGYWCATEGWSFCNWSWDNESDHNDPVGSKYVRPVLGF